MAATVKELKEALADDIASVKKLVAEVAWDAATINYHMRERSPQGATQTTKVARMMTLEEYSHYLATTWSNNGIRMNSLAARYWSLHHSGQDGPQQAGGTRGGPVAERLAACPRIDNSTTEQLERDERPRGVPVCGTKFADPILDQAIEKLGDHIAQVRGTAC